MRHWLGRLGLSLAIEKARAGFKTINYYIQPEKVKMVNERINYAGDVICKDLEALAAKGLL